MVKILVTAILLLTLNACQLFERQPSKEELVQEELKSINWNEVDEFPSVPECESITDKDLRKQCFFEFLTQAIQIKLSEESLSAIYPDLDTISVKVTVFPDSSITFEPNLPKDSLAYDSNKIDSILHARLTDFPKINPAIKRGIPVKSQFLLPVLLAQE